MIFDCKYCRARTTHLLGRRTEKNGLVGMVAKCRVCEYSKHLERQPDGSFKLNQDDVPERTILLPYDREYILTDHQTEHEAEWAKKVEKWMHNKDKWSGFGNGPGMNPRGKN